MDSFGHSAVVVIQLEQLRRVMTGLIGCTQAFPWVFTFTAVMWPPTAVSLFAHFPPPPREAVSTLGAGVASGQRPVVIFCLFVSITFSPWLACRVGESNLSNLSNRHGYWRYEKLTHN